MAATGDFSKMVPGFDFLQGLMKTAGSAMPSMGQWIAPTLDPAELDKRIEELRTVQFWLEQNARMLAATIQALEVQRMTLSTLKTMNLPVADMAEAFKIRPPAPAPAPAFRAPAPQEPEADVEADLEPDVDEEPAPAPRKPRTKAAPSPAAASAAPAGVVDPMQWWSALTQQFTELAAKALKDSTGDAARSIAGAMGQAGADAADAAGKSLDKPVKAATSSKKTAAPAGTKAAAKSPRPARRR